MRGLAASALVALALVPAWSPAAGAQTSALPDSLWRASTSPPGRSTAAGEAKDSGFPVLGLASLLVGGALLVGLRLSLRAPRREAVASLPPRRAPVALLEPPASTVVPPEPDSDEPVDVEIARLTPAVPDPVETPEEASRRHRELYDAVYQRQLDRIDRRRRHIRQRMGRRDTDAS